MTVVNILTSLSLFAMLVEILFIIVYSFLKGRGQRIEFIKNFKKGRAFLVFIVPIILYFIANVYGGEGIIEGFFHAISSVMGIVVLQFNIDVLRPLIDESLIFKIAIYISYFIVTLNTVIFALSFYYRVIWQWFYKHKFRMDRGERVAIFGINENSIKIYNSARIKSKLLFDTLDDSEGELFLKNIKSASYREGDFDAVLKTLFSNYKKAKRTSIIINFENDDKNIRIASEILKYAKERLSGDEYELFKKIGIYVFTNPSYLSIYFDLAEEACGILRLVDKYRLVAFDFVDKYPIARYMNEAHIDYSTSLVKEETDINFVLIGFGKTGKELFLSSVITNQFISEGGEFPKTKQVNYHIFDKASCRDMNFNHNFSRYEDEFLSKANAKEYLPFPHRVANFNSVEHNFDISSPRFYSDLEKIFNSGNKNKLNFLVIAYGCDLDNIELAEKLASKKKETDAENLHIFVKIRDDKLASRFEKRFLSLGFTVFGKESEIVYDYERVVNEKFEAMAKAKHLSYYLEKQKSLGNKNSDEVSGELDYYKSLTHIKRESNIYSALSLRSKLLMMGLDCSENIKEGITRAEYFDIYAKGDMPELDENGQVIYQVNFKKSRRLNMASQEHSRWIAFMITRGFVPAKISEIVNEERNGQDYGKRRHGNITTFEGLYEFRRLLAKTEGELSKYDVIKYDYQLLDDCYEMLSENGYKIFRK